MGKINGIKVYVKMEVIYIHHVFRESIVFGPNFELEFPPPFPSQNGFSVGMCLSVCAASETRNRRKFKILYLV